MPEIHEFLVRLEGLRDRPMIGVNPGWDIEF